jgi:hypothetical protein
MHDLPSQQNRMDCLPAKTLRAVSLLSQRRRPAGGYLNAPLGVLR